VMFFISRTYSLWLIAIIPFNADSLVLL